MKPYSNFLFFQQSFDNIIGLEDRMNYGLGAKVRLPLGLSVSYAFLFEKEDYKFWTYNDSLAYNLDEDGTIEEYYVIHNGQEITLEASKVKVTKMESHGHSPKPKKKKK